MLTIHPNLKFGGNQQDRAVKWKQQEQERLQERRSLVVVGGEGGDGGLMQEVGGDGEGGL